MSVGCSTDSSGFSFPSTIWDDLPGYDASVYAPPDAAAADDAASTAGLPGSPCTADTQCAGAQPLCRTHYGAPDGGDTEPFPNGSCSAYCDVGQNDPYSSLNPGCPGNSACGSADGVGLCFQTCTAKGGFLPCGTGEVCINEFPTFAACYPVSHISCDPSHPGGCAVDAGPPNTCVFEGPDLNVGGCFFACDVFAQDCDAIEGLSSGDASPPDAGSGTPQGCYPNTFGEFYCSNAGTGAAGMPCPCTAGNGCQTVIVPPSPDAGGDAGVATFVCEPFCGGPAALPCPEGLTCKDYSATVPASVVGLCSP